MNTDDELRFDTQAGFRQGILHVLSQARHELLFFERDFIDCDLGSKETYNFLWEFFTRRPAGSLQLLAADASHLAKNCPRLVMLRDHFSHCIALRQIENTYGLQQGFVIADGYLCLVRPHSDWPRGKITSNSTTIASLQEKFHALWQEGHTPGAWQNLNL